MGIASHLRWFRSRVFSSPNILSSQVVGNHLYCANHSIPLPYWARKRIFGFSVRRWFSPGHRMLRICDHPGRVAQRRTRISWIEARVTKLNASNTQQFNERSPESHWNSRAGGWAASKCWVSFRPKRSVHSGRNETRRRESLGCLAGAEVEIEFLVFCKRSGVEGERHPANDSTHSRKAPRGDVASQSDASVGGFRWISPSADIRS